MITTYHFDGFNDVYKHIQKCLLAKEKMFVICNEKKRLALIKLFYDIGIVSSYILQEDNTLLVTLKEYKNSIMLQEIKTISSPGRVVYSNTGAFSNYIKNDYKLIISTNKGLLFISKSIKINVGGIILFALR
jgi:ribosomal protein S8